MTDFVLVPAPSIMPLFLDSCPDFAPVWKEHLDYWQDRERGDFNDITILAQFIVDSFNKGNTKDFEKIFQVAESLLNHPHPHVRDLISIGLLEDIQVISSHYEFGRKAFVPWLGPLSRQEWIEIEKQWEGKKSLGDVIREEVKRSKK